MKAEIKASAAAANAAAAVDAAPAKAAPAQAVNLLDFDLPPQQNTAPSVAAAGGVAAGGSTTGDLLSLDGDGLLGDVAPVTTAAPALAPVQQQQAPVAVYTAPSSGGGLLDLGSLDVIGDSPALPGPMSAPVAVAPSGGYSAAPVQADAKGGGGSGDKDPLFDLLM